MDSKTKDCIGEYPALVTLVHSYTTSLACNLCNVPHVLHCWLTATKGWVRRLEIEMYSEYLPISPLELPQMANFWGNIKIWTASKNIPLTGTGFFSWHWDTPDIDPPKTGPWKSAFSPSKKGHGCAPWCLSRSNLQKVDQTEANRSTQGLFLHYSPHKTILRKKQSRGAIHPSIASSLPPIPTKVDKSTLLMQWHPK